MLAEVTADLRTAIATEHLVTATVALVVLGGATLLAALIAAIVAVRGYLLEATPTLVISGSEAGLPETGPLERGYLATRDRGTVPVMPVMGATARQPVVLLPMLDDPRKAERRRQIAIQVRNVGRRPVVAADLHLRFFVPEIVGFDGDIVTEQRAWDAHVGVDAIGANEAVVLPIINDIGAFRLIVVGVSGMMANRSGHRRMRRLPFSAGEMLVYPP
jgi:hypothetical protein